MVRAERTDQPSSPRRSISEVGADKSPSTFPFFFLKSMFVSHCFNFPSRLSPYSFNNFLGLHSPWWILKPLDHQLLRQSLRQLKYNRDYKLPQHPQRGKIRFYGIFVRNMIGNTCPLIASSIKSMCGFFSSS